VVILNKSPHLKGSKMKSEYVRLLVVTAICMVAVIGISEKAHANGDLTIVNMRTDYKTNPLGIDERQPRLSWEIISAKGNTRQTACELQVAGSEQKLLQRADLLWEKKMNSDQSVQVIYQGPALQSRQRLFWRVRIWDNHGRVSGWSKPAIWEMGLLSDTDWKAKWIEADIKEDMHLSQPAQYFHNEFTLTSAVESARLYITSHGLYESFLNGKRVGDQVFTPGWTSYNKRIQYQVYDVGSLLKKGQNAIGITVGDGWYRGFLAWRKQKNVYGDKLGVLAQIEVVYTDGTKETIITDAGWKATNNGPIRMADIYNGETYDARKELSGWSQAGYNDQGWQKTVVKDYPEIHLTGAFGPPVRRIEEIRPVKIIPGKDNAVIYDMGQNMVGWLRLKVKAAAGTEIRLRHAEVLDKYGNFYTENLRRAKQTVVYICNDKGEQVFEPHFTFQGFRFVEVSGFPGEPGLDALTGIVIHSDMAPTGSFTCSDSLINQLQHNIQWGLKGNFLDVPTDCPQRDERLGWTGDAQVFAPTACFNMDAASFYNKWLKDLALDQGEDGKGKDVVPDVLNGSGGHTGWADAAVVVPWVVYLNYNDTRILENQYASMKAWIEYMKKRAGDTYLWQHDWHYGDWLSFDDNSSAYMGAYTETDLIASAYFAYSTGLVAKIARILGKTEDAQQMETLANKIKSAFQQEFLTPNGRLVSHTQTAYTLALAFDLLPQQMLSRSAAYLNQNVQRFEHITTGFLGTPLICQVLTDYGYLDTAYMLLKRKKYPSWLYPVTQGATTIWERWDGQKPDSTFQNPGMNSFNHYAYGAIGAWLYQMVAGIKPDVSAPGYKHIIFKPNPGGDLTFSTANLHSIYGNIGASWKIENSQFTYTIDVPANTSATVYLPNALEDNVLESGRAIGKISEITLIEQNKGWLKFEAGSGHYQFVYPW